MYITDTKRLPIQFSHFAKECNQWYAVFVSNDPERPVIFSEPMAIDNDVLTDFERRFSINLDAYWAAAQKRKLLCDLFTPEVVQETIDQILKTKPYLQGISLIDAVKTELEKL